MCETVNCHLAEVTIQHVLAVLLPFPAGESRLKQSWHQPKPLPCARLRGLEWAVGGQCFESKVSSSCGGWMRPPGCSCSPSFLTPRCCWTRYSSGKCAGAERGAGLAPSLTLFHIFRNMNCHGYQSLGSSLATFALDVRLTKLFPHSPGGSCSCSGAVRQRGPPLHLQPPPGCGTRTRPGAWWEEIPATGTCHHCGKAATRLGHRLLSSTYSAAFPQIPIIPCVVWMPCTPPRTAGTARLSFSLSRTAGRSAFESTNRICCSYHYSGMATQSHGHCAFLTRSLSPKRSYLKHPIEPYHVSTEELRMLPLLYSSCWCQL